MLKGTFNKDGIIKDVWVNPAQIVTVEPSYKDEQTGQWYTTVTDVCGRDLTIEYSDSAIIASVDRTLHK
jgi:hypothetical protein